MLGDLVQQELLALEDSGFLLVLIKRSIARVPDLTVSAKSVAGFHLADGQRRH